jgi:hypothetical protein
VRPGLAVTIASAAVIACAGRSGEVNSRQQIVPEYDSRTGQLTLLKYDSNGDGVVDTWSYMDGPRVVRIEIDEDEDGKIDRWEYYGAGQKLDKVGFSRFGDGKEDAWYYSRADGTLDRVEISTRRDGKVARIEHYQNGALVSAEEDSDGDGRMDKWERYDGARLASVAFDTQHRGGPDRRLTYAADGSVRVEADRGDGVFIAVTSK